MKGGRWERMKKLILLCLCLLLMVTSAASADFEITEDGVTVDREALLAALFEADIASIREAIDLGLISCVELTEYYLERIEAYNETFHCFITLCDDALEVAAERDAKIAEGTAEGRLFGIPVVVKDNIDCEGWPTTNGEGWASGAASSNATVVQYLLDEGAVILGKTNMSTAAQDAMFSNSATGIRTYNAYNPDLSPGGSSGGSAAAVSLNFAVAGLGTDTNSSLRYPSALNGCVTLRTTVGLADRDGIELLNPSRDTVGAITRSVYDQAIMLDVLTGGAYDFVENLDGNALQGVRIGVLAELCYPVSGTDRTEENLDKEIQAAFANALDELAVCGAEIVEISVPDLFSLSLNADAGWSGTRERFYEKIAEVMEEADVCALVFPTYLHTPYYAKEEYLTSGAIYDQTYLSNCALLSPLTGAPELTVQIGLHSRGAGIGMEIYSLKNSEQLLLNLAYSYTAQYDHRTASEAGPSLHFGEEDLTLEEFLQAYRDAREEAEKPRVEAETEKTASETQPEQNEGTFSETEAVTEPIETAATTREDRIRKMIWHLVPFVALIVACGVTYLIYLVKESKKVKKK